MEETKITAVRIKGRAGVTKDIEATLQMLRLYRKNYSAEITKNPGTEGMLKKVKDFVTIKKK